jgi:hypothetical protein
MSIYNNSVIPELNDERLYYPGIESVRNSLEISKKISVPIDRKFNIFLYWIGDNVNYKHSVVLKSFIATQNLKNATLKIYSDVDLSEKEIFSDYKKYEQIEFYNSLLGLYDLALDKKSFSSFDSKCLCRPFAIHIFLFVIH